MISAVLLLPVTVVVAVKGGGRGTGHRGGRIVFFSAAAVLCFGIGAAALVSGGVTAPTRAV
jgi:hypothetical protein